MKAVINFWQRLPEGLRWILCWPVIFGAGFLTHQIVPFFIPFADFPIFAENGAPTSFANLAAAIIVTMAYFTCIFILVMSTVPRGNDIAASFIAAFFILISPIGIIGAILGYRDDELTLWEMIRSIIYWISLMGIAGHGAFMVREEFLKDKSLREK